jgi:uncharacterized protein with PQ loop repeat
VADDLSWPMLFLLNLGFVLWIGYGLMLQSSGFPVILFNGISLTLTAMICVMKFLYAQRKTLNTSAKCFPGESKAA